MLNDKDAATANTRSRSWSSATPSSPKPRRSPTWCCPTPPTSSATTSCRCSTGRSRNSTGRWTRCACRWCRPRASASRSRSVLVELAGRLKFPAFVKRRKANQSSATTPTSSSTSRPSRAPGRDSSSAGAARTATRRWSASRTRTSGRCTRRTTACSTSRCRSRSSTCATGTRAITSGRSSMKLRRHPDPIMIQIYAEVLQRFRLAAQGRGPSARRPPPHLKKRDRDVFRSAAVLLSSPGRSMTTESATRWPRSRSGRWRCTTPGIRRMPGCARSTRTTTCS